jgi:hypothetical protein
MKKKKPVTEKRDKQGVRPSGGLPTPKPSKKKKKITEKQFRQIVAVCSVVVPLIVCIITSAATVAAAYISHPAAPNPETRYSLSMEDRKELDRLRSEFSQAEYEGSTASTSDARSALDQRLRRIALDEAKIIRKYDPKFKPRYPPPMFPSLLVAIFAGNLSLGRDPLEMIGYAPLLVALACVGAYVVARASARQFLRSH